VAGGDVPEGGKAERPEEAGPQEVLHGVVPGEDDVVPVEAGASVDAALLLSFGAVIPGREALAVDTFVEVGRHLGRLLDSGVVSSFRPYFFADGALGDVSGFFLLEGDREQLDALRRDESFVALVLRAGAATANVRVHTLLAGSDAGRLVNLYREVRAELGLL
jgi:hypothetical protein